MAQVDAFWIPANCALSALSFPAATADLQASTMLLLVLPIRNIRGDLVHNRAAHGGSQSFEAGKKENLVLDHGAADGPAKLLQGSRGLLRGEKVGGIRCAASRPKA